MNIIDQALSSYPSNNYKGYIGECPTTEEEYETLISEQTLFFGMETPTWEDLQSKVAEINSQEAQKVTDKANALSKLEELGLTSSEIDALIKGNN